MTIMGSVPVTIGINTQNTITANVITCKCFVIFQLSNKSYFIKNLFLFIYGPLGYLQFYTLYFTKNTVIK